MCSGLSKWLQEDSNFFFFYSLIFPKFRMSLLFLGTGPDTLGGILALTDFLGVSKSIQCQFTKWFPLVK